MKVIELEQYESEKAKEIARPALKQPSPKLIDKIA